MKISKIILVIIVMLILFRKRKAVVNPTVINYNTTKLDSLRVADLEQQLAAAQLEISSGRRIPVPTFAGMLAQCKPGKTKKFMVQIDETQDNQANVLYTWDLNLLFLNDIYALDPQPTFS